MLRVNGSYFVCIIHGTWTFFLTFSQEETPSSFVFLGN